MEKLTEKPTKPKQIFEPNEGYCLFIDENINVIFKLHAINVQQIEIITRPSSLGNIFVPSCKMNETEEGKKIKYTLLTIQSIMYCE